MKVRLVLHIHTNASNDSNITPKDLINQCKENNINYVGITDHNTTKGALKYKKEIEKAGIKVIVGEEIMTSEGEIIGLFLKKSIENKDQSGEKINPEEAIRKIKVQDGLVFAPHPFDKMRWGIGKKNVLKYKDQIDAFEIFNSRTKINYFNKACEKYVEENNLVPFIGSDAHIAREITNAIIEMEDFKDKEEFLTNLKSEDTEFYKKRFKLIDIIRPTMNKVKKMLKGGGD